MLKKVKKRPRAFLVFLLVLLASNDGCIPLYRAGGSFQSQSHHIDGSIPLYRVGDSLFCNTTSTADATTKLEVTLAHSLHSSTSPGWEFQEKWLQPSQILNQYFDNFLINISYSEFSNFLYLHIHFPLFIYGNE